MSNIYETKSNHVFSYLRKKILNGSYKQGASIVISRVAKELGISAIPVREALKRLESEGLIEIIPHKGARVTLFEKNKINDVLVIRAVLEGYAARTVSESISEETLAKLNEMNKEMKIVAEEGKDEIFCELNKDFHRLLYKNSSHLLLYKTIFDLWDEGNWSKSLFAFFPEKMKESVNEHLEILQALKNHDQDTVEKMTREHKMKNIEFYNKISNMDYNE